MKLLFVALLVVVSTAAALPDDSATRNIRSKAHRELKIQQIRQGKDKAGAVVSDEKVDSTLAQRESRTTTDRAVQCSGTFGEVVYIPPNNGVTFTSFNFTLAGRYPSPDHCHSYFTTAAGYSLVIYPFTIQLASYQDILYFERLYVWSNVTGSYPNELPVGYYNGVGGPTNGSLSHYDSVDIQWNSLFAEFDASSINALTGYRGFDFDIMSVPLNASASSTPSTWTTPSWVTGTPANGPQCLYDAYINTDGYYYFESPNHPNGDYPNNWDCTTLIHTSSNRQLLVDLDHVTLENYFDNLYLIDAYTGRRLADITGNATNIAWPVRSDSSAVYAIFLTDSSVTAHGFALYFYSVVPGQQSTTSSYYNPTTTSSYYNPTTTSSYYNPTTTSSYYNPTTTSSYYNPTTTSSYYNPTTTSSYYNPATTSYYNPTSTPSYWYPTTTSRPAPWSPTPNTTTTTYTYNSGSTSTTTVQTVTTTGTSTVITDTRTSTYTYNSAEWSKLPKDKNGLYIFN